MNEEEIRRIAQTLAKAILAPRPRPHKHGLMGTNPNTRGSAPGAPDGWAAMDRGSGYAMFQHPTYERKLEEWAETGVNPWAKPAPPPTRMPFYWRFPLVAEAVWRVRTALRVLVRGEEAMWW